MTRILYIGAISCHNGRGDCRSFDDVLSKLMSLRSQGFSGPLCEYDNNDGTQTYFLGSRDDGNNCAWCEEGFRNGDVVVGAEGESVKEGQVYYRYKEESHKAHVETIRRDAGSLRPYQYLRDRASDALAEADD